MKPFQPEFYKNKRSIAAKARAARQLAADPDHYRNKGSVGGSVSGISKGIATKSPEERKSFSEQGVQARKKIAEDLRGKDLHE